MIGSAVPKSVAPPQPVREQETTIIAKTIFPTSVTQPERRREREREPEPAYSPVQQHGAAAGPAKNTPKSEGQGTLNLTQEEIARFKGTEKTIIEGEDMDIPTWMRARGKVRR